MVEGNWSWKFLGNITIVHFEIYIHFADPIDLLALNKHILKWMDSAQMFFHLAGYLLLLSGWDWALLKYSLEILRSNLCGQLHAVYESQDAQLFISPPENKCV